MLEDLNWIDLGEGHRYAVMSGKADHYLPASGAVLLPPASEEGYVLIGIIENHPPADGREAWCGGFVSWATMINPSAEEANRPTWQLFRLDPLHLEPSIHCLPAKGGCGSHGWIRSGRWVEA